MRAVQLTAFGNPVDGLEYVDIPEPDAPGPNQVLIGVEFSPINPNDLILAIGIYAFRPALPTVIGNEAVGRVLAVGEAVENVKVGDRVLAPLNSFTWRERMVISANGLFALPPDAEPQQLAMLAMPQRQLASQNQAASRESQAARFKRKFNFRGQFAINPVKNEVNTEIKIMRISSTNASARSHTRFGPRHTCDHGKRIGKRKSWPSLL